jgi:SAM-dependent methyltransferase
VSGDDVARRVAALYPTPFLRSYVRWKVAADPVYAAVFDRLRGTRERLIDVGCGAGVLAAYLRARGFEAAIAGVDHDARKIEIARGIGLRDATFEIGDVAQASAWQGTIVMLDLLHYFDDQAQSSLLRHAAATSNLIIVRDAVRDGSWRYRATYAQEAFARVVRWLKAERLHFPRRQTITGAFGGFDAEVAPLWGRTPFNNYLFVFRRSSAGMTSA